jgi:hypothetical protein
MPTYSSTQAALQQTARRDIAQRIDGDIANKTVHILNSTYPVLNTEAVGDYIEIGSLPKGSQIIPHLSRCAFVGAYQYTGSIITLSAAPVTTATCTTATTITVTTSVLGLLVGQAVFGSGIPLGATIATVTPGTGFTLSAAATSSLTGTTLTFGQVENVMIAAHTSVASGGGSHLGTTVTPTIDNQGQVRVYLKITGAYAGSPPAASPLNFNLAYGLT